MEERTTNKRWFIYPWGCTQTIWSRARMNLEITMLFFILISTKSTHLTTITTTTTTKSSTSKTTTTVTTTSTHQHKTTVPTTSSACQNATTTTTTAWDGEQRTGGVETPRWVFSHYYYYFLLTNYLYLGYMLLPPSTTLPWPRRPQPAPASCKDSLVASPSTMQAPTSHYNSLVLFFGSPSTMAAKTNTNKL